MVISGESRIALDKFRDCCRSRARHICHVVARGAINFTGITRGCAGESVRRIRSRASKRRAYIFARHYLNGTGITSTFTAVTILPAILVVTITADASVSIYGGDCAQFIPKLLATDIRRAVTARMVLYPLIYGLFLRYNHIP